MSPLLGMESAARLCGALESAGVTHVFGLPGTQTVPLFEALRRSSLQVVLPSSELAAAFMAGAYYRAAGRPAALVTIPGPGFAYALPGLAEAKLDSAALLHVTLAAPQGPAARFQLQAIPQRAIAGQLAKRCFQVSAGGDVEQAVHAAMAVALQGEPGPVVLELGAAEDGEPLGPEATLPPLPAGSRETQEVWRKLGGSRRPVLYVGQGANDCGVEVQRLAESLGAPVLTTPSARGVVPEDHPLAMGYDPCRGGTDAANRLLNRADMVLVLGARLGHNGTAGRALRLPEAVTYQVDADVGVAGASYPMAGVAICTVDAFLASGGSAARGVSDWSEEELAGLRQAMRSPEKAGLEPLVSGRSAREFFVALRSALPRSSILVTDTGLHQILTRRHYDVLAPRGLLFPSDFQSMGFGLPAAIAARLAAPTRKVAALVGDGSTAINGLELATGVELGLTLPVIVFADGFLNQIRLHQHSDFGYESAVRLPRLDFSALAGATGAGFRIVQDDIAGDLDWAFSLDRPALLVVGVGDSAGLIRNRMVARAKTGARGLLGQRAIAWMKGLRRLR